VRAPRRFLIATWEGGGNTFPAYHLGSRLVRRGHCVRMLGWPSMAARAAAAGIEFTAYPSVPPWPAGLRQDDAWEDRMVPLLHGTATRDDILAAAGTFSPDVLVTDCMLGAGFDAAQKLRLPAAALVHVLYAPFVRDWGGQVMPAAVAGLLAGVQRVLVLAPPGLDEPADIPANTAIVGPITRPGPGAPTDSGGWDVLARLGEPGRPWVLLSLSTTEQGQAAALPAMLSAVGRLPVRVLLTLGGAVRAAAVSAPPNVTVRDFVPHELVLPHMSAAVSHGGLSSITTSLAAGVPLVCVPRGREQPLNAARVAACGAGRVVAPGASAAELAACIAAVLADGAARTAARRFAAAIAALGAGQVATDEVEQLARA